MDPESKPGLSEKGIMLQRRLRWTGIIVLIVGLLAAVAVNQRAGSDDEAEYLFASGTLLSGNAKRYNNEMRSIGGVANAAAADFEDWFESLWHGKRLAHTLAFLSLAGAVACFSAAHLLSYLPASDSQPDSEGPGASAE